VKRYRVKRNYTVHSDRGHLAGGDEIPEGWLPEGHLADLLEGGGIEEIEDPPAAPQAAPASPDTGIELIERKRGQRK
jgi:hypothetical protein